jgi:hypothetical protein
VTFLFGLMHGFGFSSVLRDLGLPTAAVVPALLGFNLGVEAGQLCIVGPLFPLVLWMQHLKRLRPPLKQLQLDRSQQLVTNIVRKSKWHSIKTHF